MYSNEAEFASTQEVLSDNEEVFTERVQEYCGILLERFRSVAQPHQLEQVPDPLLSEECVHDLHDLLRTSKSTRVSFQEN